MSLFVVRFSDQLAQAPYDTNALVSFNNEGACVHLPRTDIALEQQLNTVQLAARKIASTGAKNISFAGNWDAAQQWAFVTSFCGVSFDGTVQWCEGSNVERLDNQLAALLFTKDLVNQTPEEMSPESLCDQVEAWLTGFASQHITVKRCTGKALLEAGWHGIYEVGRGSVRPPVLLEIDYNPSGDVNAEVAVALVGKGITFDSGGYSIKSSEGMLDMKCDMGGAATVAGAFGLAIKQGLNKRVKLILCCAENLISGHAYKLGDVITYKNGVTVEIVNTDAEGRLVLADGLMAAAASNPSKIIDAATLTGAAVMAVGREYNAVFGVDDEAVNSVLSSALSMNELHWRLPLCAWHSEQCPSPFADTANSRPMKGGGPGGASNAAGFLLRFVPNSGKGWIHMDLAAAYNRNGTSTKPNGATAQGMLTIAHQLLT